MNSIEIHFDPELAEFFRAEQRVLYPLDRRASIKDIVEAQGVPHTEVGEILADGCPVNFEYLPCPGRKIFIRAVQAPFDVTRPSLLRPRPFKNMRFAVDVNVGKLAPFLRMLGYDTFFDNKLADEQIAALALDQQRVVLSRDRGLLKRKRIEYGRLIRADKSQDQFQEVVWFFGLNSSNIFTRCLCCNTELESVEKKRIIHRLEPKTKKYFNRFSICPRCGRIYWPGSHWEKMNKLVKNTGMN
ncbi:MAG: Mut7-C RNAse domain-containing protein [Desulfonatronovibrio sp.]